MDFVLDGVFSRGFAPEGLCPCPRFTVPESTKRKQHQSEWKSNDEMQSVVCDYGDIVFPDNRIYSSMLTC